MSNQLARTLLADHYEMRTRGARIGSPPAAVPPNYTALAWWNSLSETTKSVYAKSGTLLRDRIEARMILIEADARRPPL